MRLLAISGSARALSTNTALLRAIAGQAPPGLRLEVFDGVAGLPVFSPDLETPAPPPSVRDFTARVAAADGILIASPEYVRSLPGGLKNALDWLVSGEELIAKPVALVHASHRGDDMLQALRLVLSTVTARFAADPFLRLPVMKKSPAEISALASLPENRRRIADFLDHFRHLCREGTS